MPEEPPAEYTWTIDAADTTDPDTIIQLGPADGTTSTSATFLFSGTDNLTLPLALTFECSLDGAPSRLRERRRLHRPPVGDHTFAVRASTRPSTPNVDGSPAEYAWTIVARARTTRGDGTNVEVSSAARRSSSRGHCGRLHLGLDARPPVGARPAERLRDGRRALLRRLHHGDVRRRRHGVPAVRRARRRARPPLRRRVGRRHARGAGRPDLRRRRQPVAVRGGRGDGRGRSQHDLHPVAG